MSARRGREDALRTLLLRFVQQQPLRIIPIFLIAYYLFGILGATFGPHTDAFPDHTGRKKWDMITLPPESAVFSVVDLVWEKKRHREPFLHSPPLKMLSARTGHILHPDYLQPLPSAPISPIEVTLKRTLSEDVNAKQRARVR